MPTASPHVHLAPGLMAPENCCSCSFSVSKHSDRSSISSLLPLVCLKAVTFQKVLGMQVPLGSCPLPDAASGLGDCSPAVPLSAFPANSSYSLTGSLRLAAQQSGQELAAAVSGDVELNTPNPELGLPGVGMLLQLPYRSLHPGMAETPVHGKGLFIIPPLLSVHRMQS